MIVMLPEKTYQNKPCVLIEQGIFNQLFINSDIIFDANKGKFIVQ
jgi:iron complex transport system ATP-binding protein